MNFIEDEDGDVFVYDEGARSEATQLKDLAIGDHFIFRGEHFIKTRNDGWFMGISNIRQVGAKDPSYLHPSTQIELLQ